MMTSGISVEDLRSLLPLRKMTNPKLAAILGVPLESVKVAIRENGLSRFSVITDADLDAAVLRGERIAGGLLGVGRMKGHLSDIGLRVSHKRISASLDRVVANRSERFTKPGKRARGIYRTYGVGHMTNLDGNDKLVKFKLQITGAVDAESRYVLYEIVGPNKRSQTVMRHHVQSGILAHDNRMAKALRIDAGSENYLLDVLYRVLGRHPIVCTSTTNVPRERLWKYTNDLTAKFHKLLDFLTWDGSLDMEDPVQVYCAHQTFVPDIQAHLNVLTGLHNSSKGRTDKKTREAHEEQGSEYVCGIPHENWYERPYSGTKVSVPGVASAMAEIEMLYPEEQLSLHEIEPLFSTADCATRDAIVLEFAHAQLRGSEMGDPSHLLLSQYKKHVDITRQMMRRQGPLR